MDKNIEFKIDEIGRKVLKIQEKKERLRGEILEIEERLKEKGIKKGFLSDVTLEGDFDPEWYCSRLALVIDDDSLCLSLFRRVDDSWHKIADAHIGLLRQALKRIPKFLDSLADHVGKIFDETFPNKEDGESCLSDEENVRSAREILDDLDLCYYDIEALENDGTWPGGQAPAWAIEKATKMQIAPGSVMVTCAGLREDVKKLINKVRELSEKKRGVTRC